jgi:hypothetical protein
VGLDGRTDIVKPRLDVNAFAQSPPATMLLVASADYEIERETRMVRPERFELPT